MSPHALSTAMTTTYGKLSYCNLNQGFLGCRPFRRAPRRSTQKPLRIFQCISSAALVHQSLSKTRRARPCWPTSTRVIAGMGSGRRARTRTTSVARTGTAEWSGSNSPMTSRRPRRPRSFAYCHCGPRRACRRAWPSSSRNHRTADECSSAVRDGTRGEGWRSFSRSLREAAPVARCDARRLCERPRTTNRSSHRDADRHPRHRARV